MLFRCMHAPDEIRPPRRLRFALLVGGLGIFLATLFSIQTWLRSQLFGFEAVMRNTLIEAFTRWPLYAALVPAVAVMVDRHPLVPGRLARRITLHVLAGMGFALVHSTIVGIVYRLLHVYPRQDTLLEAIGRITLAYFGINFVTYWALAALFHAIRYHHEVRKRDALTASLRARLVETRLDHLRAQLNPHFLFNTLNAVSTLALHGEREQIVRTLSLLSGLLRVSLDRSLPQEIPLARELEILEGYLEVQRIRFGARLAITARIEADVRDALLPSMLLQPLVENALQHGIERRPGPGRVTVVARRVETSLHVRVEDTGPGVRSASNGRGEGIGLGNTRARLAELYGESQSLEIGNLPEGGAFAQVVLPFRCAATASKGRAS